MVSMAPCATSITSVKPMARMAPYTSSMFAAYWPRIAGATMATVFSPRRMPDSTSKTCEISKIAPKGQLLRQRPQ